MVATSLAILTFSILSPLTALARSVSLDSRAPSIPAVVLADSGTDQVNGAGNDSATDGGKGSGPDTLRAQCVDSEAHPEWRSQGGSVTSSACVAALAAIQQAAGPDVGNPHIFYSKKVFPRWPPQPGAVGLPQGRVAPIRRGNCVFLVRMKNDFDKEALPLASGGYLDPEDLPVQTRTWREVFVAATSVLNTCVRAQGGAMGGWNTVGNGQSMDHEGLVVAFWPRNSIMDLIYGPDVTNTGGNATIFELSQQQTA